MQLTESQSRILPLENGDQLTRHEFELRYHMSDLRKAELIEGIVYVASPLRIKSHGEPHGNLITWVGTYKAITPGLVLGIEPTVRLDLANEPQPDDVVGGHIFVGLLCVGGGLWHVFTRPFSWAKRVLIYSGEAYLSYSLGALAYMGILAAYFISVNDTVYPTAFYGPLDTPLMESGNVSSRTWLAITHFILGILFLTGHIWHALRARSKAAGMDFKTGTFVQAKAGDPQVGDLDTPVNRSDLTLLFLRNLPIYREGLPPIMRGLEIGMAHGYLLVGPFYVLGPLRDSEQALFAGTLAAIGLVIILTVCLSIYGRVSFPKSQLVVVATDPQAPSVVMADSADELPENLRTRSGWSYFTGGFLVGGVGGALFAYMLLVSADLFQTMGSGLIG